MKLDVFNEIFVCEQKIHYVCMEMNFELTYRLHIQTKLKVLVINKVILKTAVFLLPPSLSSHGIQRPSLRGLMMTFYLLQIWPMITDFLARYCYVTTHEHNTMRGACNLIQADFSMHFWCLIMCISPNPSLSKPNFNQN